MWLIRPKSPAEVNGWQIELRPDTETGLLRARII